MNFKIYPSPLISLQGYPTPVHTAVIPLNSKLRMGILKSSSEEIFHHSFQLQQNFKRGTFYDMHHYFMQRFAVTQA